MSAARVLAAGLAVCAAWAAPVQAQTPNYAIDPTHTFVNYENGHYGTTTNRGRFSTKDGTLYFDRAGRAGKVEVIIDISSVNTGVDFLNRQIQGKDFFNVADFPTATFTSNKFVFDGDKVSEVQGQLTLKGQTHPVTLKATKFNCYTNPLVKREVCGGDFETTIQRSLWGVLWGLQFGFEDAVKLIIQIEAIKLQ
ncbi:MAG: polyisoprenoid-binding protein [Rubrivivax sp.]|nr:polyisoprenoid-binding protein [Rubrivivax sp.]